jgi:hypothetical protein|tara:strand:+ start:1553 stop:2161 length:609 start_codon:yes stop_codon:yes gene_type:complete
MKINYCPTCGNKANHRSVKCESCNTNLSELSESSDQSKVKGEISRFIEDIFNNKADILNEITETMADGNGSPKGMFFSLELRDGEPIIKSGDIEEFKSKMAENKVPIPTFIRDLMVSANLPLEFKEADTDVIYKPHKKIICVKMPGVVSMKNIEIKKRNKYLEIVGKTRYTVYFSKVYSDKNDLIVRTNIEKCNLRIELKKV